ETFQGWPKVRFLMRGLPLYDPRADSTAGGSGPMRWNDKSTWAPSHNLGLQIYNILRGIELPNGEQWGGEATAEDLPYATWAAAISACNTLVDDGNGGTEPAYRAGFEVFLDDEPFAVLEQLLAVCNGSLSESGGVWRLRVGAP